MGGLFGCHLPVGLGLTFLVRTLNEESIQLVCVYFEVSIFRQIKHSNLCWMGEGVSHSHPKRDLPIVPLDFAHLTSKSLRTKGRPNNGLASSIQIDFSKSHDEPL